MLARAVALVSTALSIAAAPAEADGPVAGHAAPTLAAIVPADDARRAVVIGPSGEVYEPDGKGAWIHRLPSWTAAPIEAAGRAGRSVVAFGDGVIYHLAASGWSAIRLARRGKAVLGTGTRPLAAVGRQLFTLDPLTRREPTRLATAPANIIAIGAGATAIVVITDSGVSRLIGDKLVPLPAVPRNVRLIGHRWAINERGAFDLATGKLTAWPAGVAVGVASAGPAETLVAIGASHAGLELMTLARGKLARDPLGVTGRAVGVVVDRAGRAVAALADGRIAVRDTAGWSTTEVIEEAPAAHPGAPPARSPAP